jgi:hypothetical protein
MGLTRGSLLRACGRRSGQRFLVDLGAPLPGQLAAHISCGKVRIRVRAAPQDVGDLIGENRLVVTIELGRLEPVEPRKVWVGGEAHDFTPWLPEIADRLIPV